MKKMDYVDLFALPVKKKFMSRYKQSARVFARAIKRLGAVDYREFVGDDLYVKGMTPFTRQIKVRPGEVLVCSYVLYKSRKARDRANKGMMNDPQMKAIVEQMTKHPIFNMKRMLYGGFKTIVRL